MQTDCICTTKVDCCSSLFFCLPGPLFQLFCLLELLHWWLPCQMHSELLFCAIKCFCITWGYWATQVDCCFVFCSCLLELLLWQCHSGSRLRLSFGSSHIIWWMFSSKGIPGRDLSPIAACMVHKSHLPSFQPFFLVLLLVARCSPYWIPPCHWLVWTLFVLLLLLSVCCPSLGLCSTEAAVALGWLHFAWW